MSLRRISLSIALTSLALLSACALRPHYKDMVQPVGAPQAADGQTLMMRLVDPGTGQPIQGAKVIAGTNRARLAATSDAQGRISVPVSQALLDENPLVEVVLPKGVKAYQFQVDSAEEPASPPASQPVEAPTEEENSTGSIAPTSPSAPETPPVPPAPSTPNPGT